MGAGQIMKVALEAQRADAMELSCPAWDLTRLKDHKDQLNAEKVCRKLLHDNFPPARTALCRRWQLFCPRAARVTWPCASQLRAELGPRISNSLQS